MANGHQEARALGGVDSAFDFARAMRAARGSRFDLFKAVWANLGGRVCGFFFALHELVDSLYQQKDDNGNNQKVNDCRDK